MDLKTFLAILWRRKLYVALALAAVAGTAWLGAACLPSFYEGQARFAVRQPGPESSLLANIGLRNERSRAGREESAEMADRVALTTVRPILDEVIQKLQIRDGRGDLVATRRFAQLSRVSGRVSLKVVRVTGTTLMRVTARSRDPEEAAMIANTIAEVYVEGNQRENKEQYSRAKQFVDLQLEAIKKEYLQTLSEIRDFNVAQGTVNLASQTQLALEKLGELIRQKEEAVIALAELKARKNTLQTQLAREAGEQVSGAVLAENPHVARLKQDLGEMEQQMAGLLAEKNPEHPDVVVLKSRIASVRRQLDAETVTVRERATVMQSVDRDIAAEETRLAGLERDVADRLKALGEIPQKAFVDNQLQLRYTVSRDLYSSLLESLNQIGIEEAMTLSDIRLVEAALIPSVNMPAGPKRTAIRSVGLVLGLILGLLLALLVERLDDTVKTPEEVQAEGLILLGNIPKYRAREQRLISGRDAQDPICEAYRIVRLSIKMARVDRPVRSLLITSPLASEGKSTTVANLGISLAREGKNVLLMDTDMRRPTLHKLFGLPNAAGITTVLTEGAAVEALIRPTGVEGLSVLTTGPLPPDPGRLVESERMRELIAVLAERFDMLILDSPPVLAVHDAIALAASVGGVVSVLEFAKESLSMLRREREYFKQAGIQPLGVIVNKFKQSGFGYGSYGYYGARYRYGGSTAGQRA